MVYVPVEPREHDPNCHKDTDEAGNRRGMFDTLHCERCMNLAGRVHWNTLVCPARSVLTVEDLT